VELAATCNAEQNCLNEIATQTPVMFELFSSEVMLSDSKFVLYNTGFKKIIKFKWVFLK